MMPPFEGGWESRANGALLIAAAAAILYLFVQAHPPSWRRALVKTAAVGALALLALIEGGPVLLVAALGLSAAGDLALAQEQADRRLFLAGLGAFLLAHLAYAALFLSAPGGEGAWRPALIVVMALGIAGMLWRLWPRVPGRLRLPVLAYGIAILAMAAAAAFTQPRAVVAGAVLFILSDMLLAWDRFGEARPWRAPAVWITYVLAQAAITLGVLL